MTRSYKSRKPIALRPFTPLRRLLLKFELFKSTKRAQSKRHRTQQHEYSDPDLIVDTPPEPKANAYGCTNSEAPRPHKPACIALQNEDSTGDIVVITALDSIPFCCHEDLLTMPHTSLLEVARTLNAKLPKHMEIDISRSRSLAAIRNDIEVSVGLRPAAPPTPKPVRCRSDSLGDDEPVNVIDLDAVFEKGPPTSPLAMRARLRGAQVGEEREEGVNTARQFKKRKVSLILEEPDMPPTPTPLPRTRRLRRDSKNPELIMDSSRAGRTHRRRTAEVGIDTSFVTTTRPNYGRARTAPGVRYAGTSIAPRAHRQPMTPPLRTSRRLSGCSPSPFPGLRVGPTHGTKPIPPGNSGLSGCRITHGQQQLRVSQIEEHDQIISDLGDMSMNTNRMYGGMEMSE